MILKGRVWKFGDSVQITFFLSGRYDALAQTRKYSELAKHLLEDTDPTFIQKVQKGDLIVAGKSFGLGKHHQGAILALKELGIAGFIAESLHPHFQRACIDMGFPALAYKEIPPKVQTGDVLELDISSDEAKNLTRGISIKVKPAPEILVSILEAGGVQPYTLRRLGVPV